MDEETKEKLAKTGKSIGEGIIMLVKIAFFGLVLLVGLIGITCTVGR